MPPINNFNLVSEYRNYARRPHTERSLSDLADILDRYFPSRYSYDLMADPPPSRIPDDPRYNPPWLPLNPPLPPLPVHDPPFNPTPTRSSGPAPGLRSAAQPTTNKPRASNERK